MIYVIRHGQTSLNTERKFNGAVDEDLDEKGLAQAVAAGENLKGIKFSTIYCSPLKRTRQTLKALNLDPSVPVIFDDRLIERREGFMSGKVIEEDFLQNVYLNYNAKDVGEGFETVPEVFERVHSLLNEIKDKHKNENVLLVLHGMVGRAVFYYFNPLPENGKLGTHPESFLSNCEIRSYEMGE